VYSRYYCEHSAGDTAIEREWVVSKVIDSSGRGVGVHAQRLGGDYVFSWQPRPSHLVDELDEKAIRTYSRYTIEAAHAKGCAPEMVLKDAHTCEHHPRRFGHWTQIDRQEIDRVCGAEC
jgi:hypothetical protein